MPSQDPKPTPLCGDAAPVAGASDGAVGSSARSPFREAVAGLGGAGLKPLLELTNVLVSKEDLHGLFAALTASLRQVLNHEYSQLLIYDEATGWLKNCGAYFPAGKGLVHEGLLVPLENTPAGWVYRTKQPLRMERPEIASRTLIWTAGTKARPLLASLGWARTAAGKVVVDDTLQVDGRPGVWAIGDCASVPDLITGEMCPPTAHHAIRQARQLANNIAATITGQTLKPFRYKPIGVFAGLGRRSAVAEILGLKFSGFFAWWLWRTAYLLKLPGLDRKVRVAMDWTLDLMLPRDIAHLRPLHLAHVSRPADGTSEHLDMSPDAVSAVIAPLES